MTEEHEIILMIVSDPLNREKNLIAADWYDDHGDTLRAKMIRDYVSRDMLALADFASAKRDIAIARVMTKLGLSASIFANAFADFCEATRTVDLMPGRSIDSI